jgi:hypothetical protein
MLRFPPGGPDQVKKIRYEARANHREHVRETGDESTPWFRLSVFADEPREGESRLDVLRRLVRDAGLARIQIESERNAICWTATVGDVQDLGFVVSKEGYPGEPESHYSIDLGPTEPDRELVERLLTAFEGPLRTSELTR